MPSAKSRGQSATAVRKKSKQEERAIEEIEVIDISYRLQSFQDAASVTVEGKRINISLSTIDFLLPV